MKGLWLNDNKFISFEELERESLTQQLFNREQSGTFWGGLFSVLPDPDLVLKKAGNTFETFDKMMNDPHIYSEFTKRYALTTSLEFRIERRNASEKYSKILEEFLTANNPELFSALIDNENDEEDANIDDLIETGLEAIPYGFKPVECVWENLGSYFLPAKLIDRPWEWFHYDQNNKLRFKSKNSPFEGEIVPPRKILNFRHKPRYNNPYGVRVLSKCFWAWMFKHSTEKWKIQFLEKFGAVWAIGKLPRGKENPEYDNMFNSLVSLINSAIGIIPDDGSVEVIDPAGKGATSKIFDENISLYNNEMSKAILTVTSLTGAENKGSYASDQVRERMVKALAMSDRKIVLRRIDQLFSWIFEVNGWGPSPIADLIEPVDYQKRTELDKSLKELGVKIIDKKYFVNNYDLKEDEFEIENNSVPPPPQLKPVIPPVEFAEADTDELREALNSIPSNTLQALVDPVIIPVKKILEDKSIAFEDKMEKIIKIVPGINTDDLETFIAKVNLISYAKGAVDASDK